jgi:nucleoside recognition membrane protein YjiH
MSSDGVFVSVTDRPKADRSLATLLTDLINQISLLIRQEGLLLRTEMIEAATRAGRGAALIAVGVIFALGGFLALLAAAALGLAIVLPPSLAAFVVAILALGIAVALLLVGKRQLNTDALMPRRTLNSLREDKVWLKEQV